MKKGHCEASMAINRFDDLDYPVPFELMMRWEKEHEIEEREAEKKIDWFDILDPSEAEMVIHNNVVAYSTEVSQICNEWRVRLLRLEQLKTDEMTHYFLAALYEAEYFPRIRTVVSRAFNLRRMYERHLALTNPQLLTIDPGRITDAHIEKAKSVPVAELFIQAGHKLRKQGTNFRTLCPFHQEKTPSCTIYTETNSFYCFGCHCHGDSIEFVKKTRSLNFPEAVRFLAGSTL